MATLKENVTIIQNAVYGKEVRPAIVDALTNSWGVIEIMMGTVDSLEAKADYILSGGNDSVTPPAIVVCGSTTSTAAAGIAALVDG